MINPRYARTAALAQGMAAAQRPMPPLQYAPMMQPEQYQDSPSAGMSPSADQRLRGTPNELPDVTPRVTAGVPQPSYDPGAATSGGLLNTLGLDPGAGSGGAMKAAMGK